MRVPGARLIPISRSEVERIRTRYPFWHTTAIPPDIYGNASEIETAGTDAVMICREDLPEELVYWITRTLFESLPELVRSLQSLRQVDLEQVHASPIPLHPEPLAFTGNGSCFSEARFAPIPHSCRGIDRRHNFADVVRLSRHIRMAAEHRASCRTTNLGSIDIDDHGAKP